MIDLLRKFLDRIDSSSYIKKTYYPGKDSFFPVKMKHFLLFSKKESFLFGWERNIFLSHGRTNDSIPVYSCTLLKKMVTLCVLPSKQNISSVSLFPRDMDRAQKSGSPRKKTEGTIKHRDPLVHVFFLYNNKMYMEKKEGDQELQRIQFSSVIFSSDRYKKKIK